MASIISASTTSATALNLSGDTTGILQLATGATPTTAVTIDASQNVGVNTTLIANTTTGKLQLSGGIQFNSTNEFVGANIYYASGWKYFGNGNGGYVKFAQSSTNCLEFGSVSNNVGGAGASATPVIAMTIDAVGTILATAPAGLGYGTGSGGTVTQATNKSTTVTLNKPTGQITMNNAALAAGAIVTFVVTNSLVAQTDTVVLTASYIGINPSNYRIECMYVGTTGQFGVRVTNISAGSLSEALQINFSIIKGATA
jgi:hypothetical protein